MTLARLAMLTLAAIPVAASAQPAGEAPSPWSFLARGGYLHQFEATLDDGGDVGVDRVYLQGGYRYAIGQRTSAGLVLGYRYDSFDFGGTGALASLRPWSDVHEVQLSAPVAFAVGERIDAFVNPQIAWAAETDAGFGDAMSFGGIAGMTYTFSDRLRLGAGIGGFSQIEDSSVFPVLLIDWQITDTLNLTTTPSTGITRGPTLNANWRPLENWVFTIGGGRENYRFRLDDQDRIGAESAYPLFAAASYEPSRYFQASFVAGAFVGGDMRLENSSGDLIVEDDYQTAPFLGISARARF